MTPTAGQPPVGPACSTCGRSPATAEERSAARLTWTRSVEDGRTVWTCPACTRTHARGIEGKLDSSWW